MNKLVQAVNQLEAFIPKYEADNKSISQAKVGWHIAHSCLVINSISGALKKSNPADYKWKFNLAHLYIRLRGNFPRGKAKAPERVVPKEEITAGGLELLILQAKNAIAELPALDRDVHFKHPYFGLLNKKSTIRFLEMHTRHHLKIIQDSLG
jgi:hypothetical protein